MVAHKKTRCKRGHEYTPDNVYIDWEGRRSCKTCVKLMSRARYRRKVREWAEKRRATDRSQESLDLRETCPPTDRLANLNPFLAHPPQFC